MANIRSLLLAMPVLITAAAAPALADPAGNCTALTGKTLSGGKVVVEKAEAGEDEVGAICILTAGFNDSTLKFEARLPVTGWNGRLVFVGGGGFDGMIMPPPAFLSRSIVTDRYATVMTNGGYDAGARTPSYFNASFAADPVKLADFTHLSEHRSLPPAKALVEAFFGRPPTRSYFEGCSMGGHDALIEAQRYPEDFDGIVARAPAGNVLGLFARFNRIAAAMDRDGGALSGAKQKLLADAVRKRCDGLDGRVNGIVTRADHCGFDPEVLRCAAGRTDDDCLTDTEMDTVAAITRPWQSRDGQIAHAGFPFGGEDSDKGWGEYMYPQLLLLNNSLQGLFSKGFIRAFITRDPDYDPKGWEPSDWASRVAEIKAQFQANNPDLSGFAARGGKLILWTGETDSSVSPRETENYFNAVRQALGPDRADDSVALYTAPGVGHCFGGPGHDQVDLLAPLVAWVEKGVVPATLSATRSTDKTAPAQPLCRYPQSVGVTDGGNLTCW